MTLLEKACKALQENASIHHPYTPSPEYPEQCAQCGSSDKYAHVWRRGDVIGNGEAPKN